MQKDGTGFHTAKVGESITLRDGTTIKVTRVKGRRVSFVVDRPGGEVAGVIKTPLLTRDDTTGTM